MATKAVSNEVPGLRHPGDPVSQQNNVPLADRYRSNGGNGFRRRRDIGLRLLGRLSPLQTLS